MIHGVYLKSKPKNRWQLISLTTSPEVATSELSKIVEQAKLEGFEEAESGVQLFESIFNIPESLLTLKDHKIMYN